MLSKHGARKGGMVGNVRNWCGPLFKHQNSHQNIMEILNVAFKPDQFQPYRGLYDTC